jgi:AbrB family looped-hinge helix DNA binding protein
MQSEPAVESFKKRFIIEDKYPWYYYYRYYVLPEATLMRVTTKGQVTIPQEIRDKYRITPAVEIDFIEEKDRIYLVKKKGPVKSTRRFGKLKGVANVKMTTDEIMALTRGGK